MARRPRGKTVNLDSFLDIMTCMLGVLMLIILLTGVDASQIRVLIPTPMLHPSDRFPIFIECRNNELFLVPLDDLRKIANDQLKAVAQQAGGDTALLLEGLAQARAETDTYRVDLTYALLGQFAIQPIPTSRGYRLADISRETETDWYGRILTRMNRDREMLTFLVRDDSYEVFKRARALAWVQKVEVSYELLSQEEAIKFGLGGSRSLAQ